MKVNKHLTYRYCNLWLHIHSKCTTQADYIVLSTFGRTIQGLIGIKDTIGTPMASLLTTQSNVPYNVLHISARKNEITRTILWYREQHLLNTFNDSDITHAIKRMKDVTQ